MKMMHTTLEPGQVGEYAILPQSPELAERVTELLDEPEKIAYNREYKTINGKLDGTLVSVTSTGIGGPSSVIAVEELHKCGVHTMIQIGTCILPEKGKSSAGIVFPKAAVRMEGVGLHYLPEEFPAVPDIYILEALEQAAKRLGYSFSTGITITSSALYHGDSGYDVLSGEEQKSLWSACMKGGAVTADMECAPVFIAGGCLGIRIAGIVYGKECSKDNPEDNRLEEEGIRTAVEALKIIIRKDQENKLYENKRLA